MGKKSRRQTTARTPVGALPAFSTYNLSMVFGGAFCILLLSTLVAAQFKSQPRLQSYQITKVYPHDPDAFTQGLEYDLLCNNSTGECTDILWESTGMNGNSEVRMVELNTGKVLKSTKLAASDFGEGLVKSQGRLLQLTWRSNKVLSYAENDLSDVTSLATSLRDGWGVTHGSKSGTDLVISDGSAKLHFVDRDTLATKQTLEVKDEETSVPFLNELEWVRGEVWANVWQTHCLARIHPDTGKIRGWILLHGLFDEARKLSNQPPTHPMDVLNGIAWDKTNKRLFVTGKYWPAVFEISLRPHPGRLRPEILDMARAQCIPTNTMGMLV